MSDESVALSPAGVRSLDKEFPDVKPGRPLPWTTQSREQYATVYGPDGERAVADCYRGFGAALNDAEMLANAAYIVAACNAYPLLRARLSVLLGRIEALEQRNAYLVMRREVDAEQWVTAQREIIDLTARLTVCEQQRDEAQADSDAARMMLMDMVAELGACDSDPRWCSQHHQSPPCVVAEAAIMVKSWEAVSPSNTKEGKDNG